MTRYAAKTDTNQAEIVEALRQVGATVQPLHFAGRGIPDLICGYRGANYLLEVKDGRRPASKRQLTSDEAQWHEEWRGQVAVVASVDDALTVIGAI